MTVDRTEAGNDVGDVVFLDLGALIVQTEAIGLHIIEPNFIRAACAGLGKDQNTGGQLEGVDTEGARVRLKEVLTAMTKEGAL